MAQVVSFKSLIILGMIFVAQVTGIAAAQNENRESNWKELDRVEKIQGMRKADLDFSFEFFGKVVDFTGQPVPDAEVTMRVRYVPLVPLLGKEVKIVNVVTDNAGRFSVREDGYILRIEKIEKDGYQFRQQYNKEQIFAFKKNQPKSELGQQKDKPIVFRVRKKAAPAFVLSRGLGFGLRTGKISMLDLIKMEWVNDPAVLVAMQYSSIDRDWHPDLHISVEGEAGNLRLIIETPDPDSGFVVERHEFLEEMTEAPEHGYRSRLEIPAKSQESQVFLYMKAQGGLFYSKLKFGWREPQPGLLEIDAVYHTNLTGGRGLEYTPAIESQYDWETNIDHTRKEVRRADLLSGKPIEMPKVRK